MVVTEVLIESLLVVDVPILLYTLFVVIFLLVSWLGFGEVGVFKLVSILRCLDRFVLACGGIVNKNLICYVQKSQSIST